MDRQMDRQDIQEMIDAALTPLYARTGFMQGVQANHAWSTNTGGIAVGITATGLESVTLPAVPKSGKLRIIGNITFTNSAAATHALTPLINITVGSVLSNVYTGASVALISGADDGNVAVVYELPASVAATFAGTTATVTVILQATADALTAISVATGASTLSVQEIF